MHAYVSASTAGVGAPTVVLVHGVGVAGESMVPVAERLAPYCTVYVPDFPGFGLSDKPDHTLNVPELADALAAWMRAIGLERGAVLGNSFGCQITAEFTVRYPERVERVMLQSPVTDPKTRSLRQQVPSYFRNAPYEKSTEPLTVVRAYRRSGILRALQTIRYSLEYRIKEQLPRIQVPALVVRGERDSIVSQRWAEEATRLLPDGRLVVIPGVAHAIHLSAPLEVARTVRPFLEEGR